MTEDLVVATPETTVREAANLMRGHAVNCLPVLDGQRLAGIITALHLLEVIGRGAKRPGAKTKRRILQGHGQRLVPAEGSETTQRLRGRRAEVSGAATRASQFDARVGRAVFTREIVARWIQTSHRHTDVYAAVVQPAMLRDQAEGADLAVGVYGHTDVDDAAQANGHAASEPHWRRLQHPVFDDVAGNVHVSANDDVVAELEEVVVADRQRVHVHPTPDASTVHAQVRNYDIRERLEELRSPTLFLAAEHDHLVPSIGQARFMAARVTGAAVEMLPGHGHICLIAPDLDLRRIIEGWRLQQEHR